MNDQSIRRIGTVVALCTSAAWVFLLAALVVSATVHGQDARSLLAHEARLRTQLADNAFQRSIAIESSEASSTLKGDVYAIVAMPYSRVGQALGNMDNWCDVLILHLNVKNCRARGTGANGMLGVAIGSRFDQPLADAYRVDFKYRTATNTSDYLRVLLSADAGPLGTKNFRIVFEAAPLDSGRSFVHMSYAYGYGVMAQFAMRAYLGTVGRDKVGFSVVEPKNGDMPIVYLAGVRGLVERNAMRYFLAIDAFLGAYASPVADQQEKRLDDWFTSVERYPRQLHELERDVYLSMKRREITRQKSTSTNAD